MERIVEHIERLLLWHDCVIIPDFGGFVLQSIPAVYTGEEHLFIPARKEIVFNPTLTHNDGLLTESYMQSFSVAYSEAQTHVRADVTVMKEDLDKDRQIQFGRIGFFIKEYERIIFVPSGDSGELFCTSSYGLPVFHYLSLAARQLAINYMNSTVDAATDSRREVLHPENNHENPSGPDNIIYTIPVTHMFMRVLVAAVAAVILFFLISTPVKDVNKASYSASFVPQEIMPKMSADEIISNAFSAAESMAPFSDENASGVETGAATDRATDRANEAETAPEVKSESPAVKPESEAKARTSTTTSVSQPPLVKLHTTKPSAAKAKPAPAGQSSASQPAPAASGKYYVIIGSFNNRAQAQGYIKRLKGDVAGNAGIVVNDGKVRVYAQQFSGEKPALSYLDQIRQNPNHKQAWLYKKP